jgi:hypothetical protein
MLNFSSLQKKYLKLLRQIQKTMRNRPVTRNVAAVMERYTKSGKLSLDMLCLILKAVSAYDSIGLRAVVSGAFTNKLSNEPILKTDYSSYSYRWEVSGLL